ncbi:MAG: hypothetical protein IPI67_12045 [Myxococcales bacterium]|nr:hypothetical protein [Myxococcales bacterium]
MALADRLQQLEPRERQLLGILVTVFAGLFLLAVPAGVAALLSSKRAGNEALREAVESIQAGRAQVAQRDKERRDVVQHYANVTPPLASFLEKVATQSQIEIPESQDRAVVPHGKRFEERSTKIVLRKVGMLSLVKFMEKIGQSGHPVSMSRVNIRKRGTEPDSYDVEMIVSAFDRKVEEKKKETKPDRDSADNGAGP